MMLPQLLVLPPVAAGSGVSKHPGHCLHHGGSLVTAVCSFPNRWHLAAVPIPAPSISGSSPTSNGSNKNNCWFQQNQLLILAKTQNAAKNQRVSLPLLMKRIWFEEKNCWFQKIGWPVVAHCSLTSVATRGRRPVRIVGSSSLAACPW